jgi:C-terminal domain of 1-Cys peroxiredoxin
VSKLYGMLPAPVSGDPTKRTAADNQTVRNVFVIGPDKKVKLILVYPMTTGRNFDEVLRVIDSLQLTANHKVATPVNWKNGEDVIIAGPVSEDDAKKEGAESVSAHSASTQVVQLWHTFQGPLRRRQVFCLLGSGWPRQAVTKQAIGFGARRRMRVSAPAKGNQGSETYAYQDNDRRRRAFEHRRGPRLRRLSYEEH